VGSFQRTKRRGAAAVMAMTAIRMRFREATLNAVFLLFILIGAGAYVKIFDSSVTPLKSVLSRRWLLTLLISLSKITQYIE
jgi:hypothetical protein